jgi:hypothetical protein
VPLAVWKLSKIAHGTSAVPGKRTSYRVAVPGSLAMFAAILRASWCASVTALRTEYDLFV